MKQRTCPECETELRLIQVVFNVPGAAHGAEMRYTAPDAQRSPWSGKFPTAGPVHAFGCPGCGRVLFYAERAVDRLPLPSAAAETDPTALPIPSEASEPAG